MALNAATIWEVETGGDDTNNGGAFDPSRTAGMFTDGAATSATGASPVFSSASYNFAAGDVGAWVYIASGTNWIPGWYKISSVSSNVATLNGTAGQGVLKTELVPTTATGCATTASPTGATWTIDYSQQTTARYTYTDLASAGAGLTVSSAAKPFAKEQVGNCLVITGGTNFNAGRYVISSVAAGVATVLGPGNITSGAGASGTGGQGGAMASLGLVGSVSVASNVVFVQSGSYSITSASSNVSAGCFVTTAVGIVAGYGTVHGDLGTAPVLTASGISTATLIDCNGAVWVANLTVDGATLTAIKGVRTGSAYKLWVKNCTNTGLAGVTDGRFLFCRASGCTTAGAGIEGRRNTLYACEAYSNTVTGFTQSVGAQFVRCLAYANTGASSDGFDAAANTGSSYVSCVAYGNGRDGFRASVTASIVSCIAEGNTGVGFDITPTTPSLLTNCASYNNSGGAVPAAGGQNVSGASLAASVTALSGSPFTNAAGGDFSLNNTASAGASCRAAGIPGVFPAGTTTGYLDIGAAQHADPASSGGAVFIFGG